MAAADFTSIIVNIFKYIQNSDCVTLCFAAKLVPLAYGIHKLQISCVVEDDKVSVDWLQETLEAIEDYVSTVYNNKGVMKSSLAIN